MPDRCHLVATKGIFSTWIFWAAHVCWAWPKGSWVLWAAPCSKKCWQHLPPEPCSRLTSPPEISNRGLPPSQRAQGMDLGVCASGKQPTPPCTDGWGGLDSPFSATTSTPLLCKLPRLFPTSHWFSSQLFHWLDQKQISPTQFPQKLGSESQEGQ